MTIRKKGSGHGTGSKTTQFKSGKSGNLKGRPKKQSSTFESEVKAVLSKLTTVKIDGEYAEISKRQLVIEQIVNLAIKGNPTMARLTLSFMKVADDIPELEVLPEDEAALKAFMAQFNEEGES